MAHTRRISIVNHKGGVGKTTTAINLAAGLGQRGRRTLLIDWDPQANTTQFLGLSGLVEQEGVYGSGNFASGEAPFSPHRNVLPGVDLLPATEELSFFEERMLRDAVQGAAFRLGAALEQVSKDYDFVVADCGPSIGMMAMSAMIACPEVIIPIKLEFASIPGAFRLHKNILALRSGASPEIRILGVIGTMYVEGARTPHEVLTKLREIFGDTMFETVIHRAQAVADSAGRARPIVLADGSSRGAIQYDKLTDEVLARG
jgi:chromosome partitioning protein